MRSGAIVADFDLTFFLPFKLADVERREVEAELEAAGGWEREFDLRRRGMGDYDGLAYGEWAYFHPFTQAFLYGKGFDLYRRRKEQGIRVSVTEPGWPVDFELETVEVRIWDDGVGILSVRLAATGRTEWAACLNSISLLRQIFVPYYKLDNEKNVVAGGVPTLVRMCATGGGSSAKGSKEHADDLRAILGRKDSRPPIVPHWAKLFEPFGLATGSPIRIRLFGDHRMATMAHFTVPDPAKIEDEDWAKLVEADESAFPAYTKEFTKKILDAASYDRWFDRSVAGKDHRYLTGAMTFLCVLKEPGHGSVRDKWHRHYTQLYLLAQYQRAALLDIQKDLSAVSQESKAGLGVLKQLEPILQRAAAFSANAWFEEVSPQVQGQELFDLIRRQMRLNELYRVTMEDKAVFSDWVQARWQKTATEVGTFIAAVGLGLGFLGINVLIEPAKCELPVGLGRWGKDALIFVAVGIGVLVFGRLLARKLERGSWK